MYYLFIIYIYNKFDILVFKNKLIYINILQIVCRINDFILISFNHYLPNLWRF